MLRSSSTATVFFVFFLLVGCGGSKFTGTLGTGGPISTQPPPAGSTYVTSVSPAFIPAGSAATTITVTGSNFAQGDSVYWNTQSLNSTFVSSTTMQATVPANLLASPTSVSIDVQNSSTPDAYSVTYSVTVPVLSGNGSYSNTFYAVQANDIVWDPVTQLLYLSITNTDTTNPGTIASLDPATNQLRSPISVGGNPDRISISSDDSYLYVGVDDKSIIQRYLLPNLTLDITVPLTPNNLSYPFTNGTTSAASLRAMPGNPHVVAAALAYSGVSSGALGVALFQDATELPNLIYGAQTSNQAGEVTFLDWNSNGNTLYGIDGTALTVISANSSGVQVTGSLTAPNVLLNSIQFEATTGDIYFPSGQVMDPTSGKIVSTFPLSAIQGGISAFAAPVMVADGGSGIAYFLFQPQWISNPSTFALVAYNMTNSTYLGGVNLNITGSPRKLIRYGTNGLAILTASPYMTGSAAGDGVYLISGPFVTNPAIATGVGSVPR